MEEITREVIESVSIQVREKLKDHILAETYHWDYFPNKNYEDNSGIPSYEFLEAFRLKETRKTLNDISRELFYNWEVMTVDRGSGRHFENGKDMRKRLADLLNVNDVFGHKQRADYWNRFIHEMFEEGELEKLFSSEFKKRGVNM